MYNGGHMVNQQARDWHEQGGKLREEGKLFEAAAVLTQAILLMIESDDWEKLPGALGDRAYIWKHEYLKTKQDLFITLYEMDVQLMLAVAEDHELSDYVAKATFMMGEAEMMAEDYEAAVTWFTKALGLMLEVPEKGSLMCHLGEAWYRNGDKPVGLEKFEAGIAYLRLQEAKTDSFEYKVWLSGAFLRLAELLQPDDSAAAKTNLEKAKAIIFSDDRLILRKQQYERLRNKFPLDL